MRDLTHDARQPGYEQLHPLVPSRAEIDRQMEWIMEGVAIQKVSTHRCFCLLCSWLAAAAAHAPLMTDAHIVMLGAACSCFFSHRFSMLLQR